MLIANAYIITLTNRVRNFCLYMKTKLRDMNQDTQLLALDFLDYSVDNGKMPLWTQVGTKDFLMCLITLLKTRDIVDVQAKILFLIEKWGKKFDRYKEILPIYQEVYSNLKSGGVAFPTKSHSTYSKYTDGSNKSGNRSHQDNDNDDYGDIGNEYDESIKNSSYKHANGSYSEIYMKLGLDTSLFEKKYNKLVLKLIECTESIVLSNDMIDNFKSGKIDEVLRSIIHDLRHDNSQIIETISSDKLKDERLMEISLGISEDILRTLKRYDAIKKGKRPEPLLSYFVENSSDFPIKNNIKDKVVNHPQTQLHPQMNLFEDFEILAQVNQNQSSNVQAQNQSSLSTVNDLFDIFSNQQPVNNNNNNNNIIQQSNIGAYDMFNNNNLMPQYLQQQQQNSNNIILHQEANLINQISSNNTQQNQMNENKQNMLFEQLKMAYGNNSNSNNNSNTNNVNIGLGINPGINMNTNMPINQPNFNNNYNNMPKENLTNLTQAKQSLNSNPQLNMSNFQMIPNQSNTNYPIMNQFNQSESNQNLTNQNMNLYNNNNPSINFNQPPISNNQNQMGFNQNQAIPNPYSSLFN